MECSIYPTAGKIKWNYNYCICAEKFHLIATIEMERCRKETIQRARERERPKEKWRADEMNHTETYHIIHYYIRT